MARLSRFGFLNLFLIFMSVIFIWMFILLNFDLSDPTASPVLSHNEVLTLTGLFLLDALILGIATLYGTFMIKSRYPLLSVLSWFTYTDAILFALYILLRDVLRDHTHSNGLGFIDQSTLLACSLLIFTGALVWTNIKFSVAVEEKWTQRAVKKEIEKIRKQESRKAEKEMKRQRKRRSYRDDDDYDEEEPEEIIVPVVVEEKKRPMPLKVKVKEKENVVPEDVKCPECGKVLSVTSEKRPLHIRCGNCDSIFTLE